MPGTTKTEVFFTKRQQQVMDDALAALIAAQEVLKPFVKLAFHEDKELRQIYGDIIDTKITLFKFLHPQEFADGEQV
jgi:hypothetical protein